jgi:hypothetical protein
MKTFLIACVAAVVIAVIGLVVLGGVQMDADQIFKTESVRLGA